MNQGIELLDEALALARSEKSALMSGEYEDAMGLAEKRAQLTGMACNLMAHAEQEPFRAKLQELLDIQSQLTALASKAHDSIRQQLNRSKIEQKRMRGYQMAVSQALQ